MTLTPQHYAKLHTESAITDEVITARGYISLDDPAAVEALGFPAWQAKSVPALAIPLWNVYGQQSSWQIRPDSPRLSKGKLRKYETMAESRLQLDVPPSVQPFLGDPRVPLWVTEGVKKGDALASAGACAIALMGGVWGFKGTNEYGAKGVILTDWQSVALNGRKVYVVFDSDSHTKKQVAQALKALCDYLRSRDALPTPIEWPEAYRGEKKWGVDDFLAAGHTLDDVLAMVPPSDPVPSAVPPPPNGQEPPAPTVDLLLTKDRRPRGVLANVLTVLVDDTRWQDVLGYNALSDEVVFLARPPCYGETEAWKPRALEDHDDGEITSWVQRQHQVFTSTTTVHEAIQTAAHRNPYHPIRDYLRGLKWDEEPRLDRWLTTYCGVEDTLYTRAVGRTTLIGAVARVMQPGAKVDTAPVLIGEQGIGKSTTWRVLCGDEWFSDTLPDDLKDKDALQNLRGKWIIELADLASLHGSAIETVKRYLSASQDHYRPSYGRRAKTYLRQNIFVASSNRPDICKDETGNRRLYPLQTTGRCRIEALTADRNQLWAEAMHRYRDKEAWHLDPAMAVLAAAVQHAHLEHDPWTEPVLTYVEPFVGKTWVTTVEVMQHKFHWDVPALWTPVASKRIGAILRKDGWRYVRREVSDFTPTERAAQPAATATPPAVTPAPKAPRQRVAAFEKDAPSTPGTDGTDDTAAKQPSVPSGNPHEIRRGTDGTDGTDTFTYVREDPGKTQKTHKMQNTQISPPALSNVGKPSVPSVPSVPSAQTLGENGLSPIRTIRSTAQNSADIRTRAAPTPCQHLDTSLQDAGLVCTRCGAALF